MVTPALGKVTNATLLHQETIVRRLDDYPELTQALRDGDLPTARMLCARLFDFDARPGEPQPQPVASIIRTG